jgi:hypothetical protein
MAETRMRFKTFGREFLNHTMRLQSTPKYGPVLISKRVRSSPRQPGHVHELEDRSNAVTH